MRRRQAYAAAAGMRCTIYTPAANSPTKLGQIQAYGARLVSVPGDRADVARMALEEADGAFYASHNLHPAFIEGVSTLGLELWEQSGTNLPDAIVVPMGNGTIALGLSWAFAALERGGEIDGLPRIYGVQSESFPSLAEAFASGASEAAPARRGPTIAEGIACELSPRGGEVLSAVRASGGAIIAVGDAEIREALRRLVRAGYYVEPSSAAAAAGIVRLVTAGLIAPGEEVLVPLTGSGLKVGGAMTEVLGEP